MSSVTFGELREIMRQCVGAELDELRGSDADVLDTPFLDLGFDSLALLETAAVIKREHGIVITDDDLLELDTPRKFLGKVNAG